MAEIFDSNGVRLQQADPSDDVNDLLVTGFTFPDQGHVIPALVLKGTKDRVQGLNIQKSPESAEGVAIVKESGLGGQGLFATRALSTGELILSERPIMVTRAEFPADTTQIETYLRILFARLPQAHQVIFSKLSSVYPIPLLGRLRTNGFTFSPYPLGPPHAGIFSTLSRVNHSCGPNAFAHFNHSTWGIELRATRSIKANEEITISYVDVLEGSMERRNKLAEVYKFGCKCHWCSLPAGKQAESDGRRKEIALWSQGLLGPSPNLLQAAAPTKESRQESIKVALSRIVAATREGLEPFTWAPSLVLSNVYMHLGDEKNFKLWRGKAGNCLLANLGVTQEVEEVQNGTEDVTQVEGWGSWVQG